MNKLLMLLIVAMLVLPAVILVSAQQETLGVFARDDCINLVQICGNCTYVNITTVKMPNGSVSLGSTTMTKTGAEYNHDFCQTNITGTYVVNGVAGVDGYDTPWAYSFEITNNGIKVSQDYSFMLGMIIFVIFGIAIFFMILTYKIEVPAFKIFFFLLSLIFLFGSTALSVITIQSTNISPTVSGLLSTGMIIVGIIFFLMFVWIMIKQTRDSLELLRVKKGLSMGMDNTFIR